MPAKKSKQEIPAVEPDKYTKEELIAAAGQVFGVPQECVVAALRNSDGPLSVEEAKNIVTEFMNMEVK